MKGDEFVSGTVAMWRVNEASSKWGDVLQH